MPPRHQQRDEGKFRRVSRQEGRQQMPFEVMNARERHTQGRSQRGRHPCPHQQGAGQAGALGIGHTVYR